MKYKTDINIILDRSSSMSSVKRETIIGFNAFLKEQRQSAESARISLHQFNTVYNTVYNDVDIKLAPKLNNENFSPSGMTALLDAIGRTINDVGARLRNMPEKDRPEQVLVVVITDGEENSSRQFTKSQIEEMINHQTDVYKWQFVYTGVNFEAIAAGRDYQSFGSNTMDIDTLTAGGALVSPGEFILTSFNKIGKSVRRYRHTNDKNSANFMDYDQTSNEEAAKEVKAQLESK